jgi:hypothetical protein
LLLSSTELPRDIQLTALLCSLQNSSGLLMLETCCALKSGGGTFEANRRVIEANCRENLAMGIAVFESKEGGGGGGLQLPRQPCKLMPECGTYPFERADTNAPVLQA